MRDIKFKAWHKGLGQMYWFELWGNHNHGGGYIGMVPWGMERAGKSKYDGNVILVDPDECEIMQYTGKETPTGESVYEGDFCKASFRTKQGVQEKTGTIIFDEFMWCLEDVEGEIYSINRLHGFEVLGNIYETPELLKIPA